MSVGGTLASPRPTPTATSPIDTYSAYFGSTHYQADYYRYLAEFSTGASKTEHADQAEKAYTAATDSAAGLAPTHPIRTPQRARTLD